ncbi:MAG: ribosome biogenesis GTPase Der [Planctomycetota bacterium]|jgi:GTP-binding protein
MAYPSAAIIGRPNVGKSTLFNTLVGRRISIEDPTSGVTRDRILHPVTHEARTFELIDTGGIGIVDVQDLSADVESQIDIAIKEADVLIFLVDCREGVTPLDLEIADRIRKMSKQVILAANKADTDNLEHEVSAFYEFGLGEILPVSAQQGRNLTELLSQVVEKLPEEKPEPEYEGETLKIAFVGKRNVGKSSIINKIAGTNRVIVSDRPGTTRDAVDVLFEKDNKRFVAIDTAGLRRRGKMDDSIEFYGHVRSERSIRRADVVVLMIDASVPISKVDKRIGNLISEEFKPCIIAINKWDLAVEAKPNITPEEYHDYLVKELPGLYYAPITVTSALSGKNVWSTINIAYDLQKQATQKVTTGQLNKAARAAYEKKHPPMVKGKTCNIYYATQSEVCPPTFIVFCSRPKLIDANYIRYFSGQLRQALGFEEVPLKFSFRSSHEDNFTAKQER